jgi:hypothetical protein
MLKDDGQYMPSSSFFSKSEILQYLSEKYDKIEKQAFLGGVFS